MPKRKTLISALVLSGLFIAVEAAIFDANGQSCPPNAIAVEPGTSIQAAVNRAAVGAVFCLKNGTHREQAVRPRSRQRFHGEGRTILNGSRILTGFRREGRYWTVGNVFPNTPPHGECLPSAPTCNRPEVLFIDGRPMARVLSKDALVKGKFYVDYPGRKIYLLDDPRNRRVEATVASFAFDSTAADVSISNVLIEKYASPAQKGAIHAREGVRWTVENCEMRRNSGAGISVGSGSNVRNCAIHHNGQIGIEGNGRNIRIESNQIWSNNIYGFDPAWEAGGVKITEANGVAFRVNNVRDNNGPGLWCDIDCRNVVYENNQVEHNQHIGIFHEISFKAVIRNNVVRHNGRADRSWFWGADITLAASQDVTVTGNTLTVSPRGCGIVLIDQGRRADSGRFYKTQNNFVHDNQTTFEGAACAGGTSDTRPGHPNFSIITKGNNRFDRNTYRVPRNSGPARYVWGEEVTDWDGFRQNGQERNGRQVLY